MGNIAFLLKCIVNRKYGRKHLYWLPINKVLIYINVYSGRFILDLDVFPRLSSLGFVSGNVTESVSQLVSQSVNEWVSESMSQGAVTQSTRNCKNAYREKYTAAERAVMASAYFINNGSTHHSACETYVYQPTTKAHIVKHPHSGHRL